jgi:plasmid maintenance system antidote protein VapI
MMSDVELQRQMLKHRMSIIDMATRLHVTKDQVKRFMNGKEKIPLWVQIYFGELHDESKKGSPGKG